jgi:tRNA (guanine37-N1)-methyltransferase
VAEGRANDSFEIPPLTDGIDATEASLVRNTVLVARLRGRLVGAVTGSAGDAGDWTIGRLIVAPDLQGRGIGGRLLAEAEAAAPPNRTVAKLITGAGSKRNLGFYLRRGYRVIDRDENATGAPIVIMEKVLS